MNECLFTMTSMFTKWYIQCHWLILTTPIMSLPNQRKSFIDVPSSFKVYHMSCSWPSATFGGKDDRDKFCKLFNITNMFQTNALMGSSKFLRMSVKGEGGVDSNGQGNIQRRLDIDHVLHFDQWNSSVTVSFRDHRDRTVKNIPQRWNIWSSVSHSVVWYNVTPCVCVWIFR